MSHDDEPNVPPPPGGYGAGPYRAPQAPPPMPDIPPPPRNTGRWAAGGIGIALLAVRACLLFARLGDDSSYSSSYNYTPPPTFPTYDPLAGLFGDGGSLTPRLPPTGGHLAVGDGDTVVFDDQHGKIRDGDGKIVCDDYCTTSHVAIVGKKVYWVNLLDEELRTATLGGDGTATKVTELHVPGSRIVSDGASLYVVAEPSDEADKRGIIKIDPSSGKQTKLVSVDGTIEDLQVSGGRVYFTWLASDAALEKAGEKPSLHLRSVSTLGGAVTKLADPSLTDAAYLMGAVGGGYYYLAHGDFMIPEHIGRVPVGGGAFEAAYDAGSDEILGPIAADASGLYFARHRDGEAWAIAHLTAKAKAEDVLTGIAEEPQGLGARKNDLVFTSYTELTHTPKTATKP